MSSENAYTKGRYVVARLKDTANTEAERLLADALARALRGKKDAAVAIGVEALTAMEDEANG